MKPRPREDADTLQDRIGVQNDFDRLQKLSEMKMKFNKVSKAQIQNGE